MARLLDILNQDEWIGLSQYLGETDGVPLDLITKINLNYGKLLNITKFERQERNNAKKYSLLVIPPVSFYVIFIFYFLVIKFYTIRINANIPKSSFCF